MNEREQNLINKLINSFSNKLKPLVENFVIKENKAFVTLKALDSKNATQLEQYKKECEEILKNSDSFDEIFVTFVEKQKQFDKIVTVSSCKGGVGKSTIAVNLALALNKLGYSVGLLDADIYGPSIPKILNISNKPQVNSSKKIIPVEVNGLKVMSIGLLIDDEKPVVWRGPMVQGALTQLIDEVNWGKLDFMIIDLPPGTGDAYLAILQKLKIDKSLIVTTSQDLAIADTKKGINLMLKFNIPVTGIIENMSFFECDLGKKYYIFGENKVESLAKQFKTEVIAKLPIFKNSEKEKDTAFDNLVKKLF
ncbi:Mrp/NBP35 family ATP-binding protein [Alphaproteobacteria bacterium]|nr:Mrp/NBP35 family ATP-binding protein [Alphaproteobacteria bacterium]